MGKSAKLHELEQLITEQQNCSVLAQTASRLVMGQGDYNADIVFIGEAPGKKEDETGLPFQGAAGRILNSALEAAGIKRDSVYITNVVKYRPPNNRDPSRDEKAAFLPYLLQEIDIINPRIIVPLGRHAMEYFLPGATITDVRGVMHHVTVEGRHYTVFPMYHPAAMIYNRDSRQAFFDDMAQLGR